MIGVGMLIASRPCGGTRDADGPSADPDEWNGPLGDQAIDRLRGVLSQEREFLHRQQFLLLCSGDLFLDRHDVEIVLRPSEGLFTIVAGF